MDADQQTSPGGDALTGLARGTEEQVRSYFHVLGERQIASTDTKYRVHWLTHDANGRHRTKALAKNLYYRITDYCIPRSRVDEAKREDARDGGTAHISRLQDEAKELFLDSDKSGEGGELLLFYLLEAELGIPQILCKMPLKTNRQMPIHGVDGVHAEFTSSGNLSVYWGESKLYADFQSAATECLTSIAPFLLDDGSGPAHRDILLVRDNLDVGNLEMKLKLARYFTEGKRERLDLEIRGACLIAFSHAAFGIPFGEDGSTILPVVAQQLDAWADSVRARIHNRDVTSFTIEFFCLPLPSVAELRLEFQRLLGN